MNQLAPVILFVYNRPKHTNITINSLLKNKECAETDLFIFSDAAKNESSIEKVNQVRSLIHEIKGFKNIFIVEQRKNLGLANSIISGVTEIINRYNKAIVLEDDLKLGSDFLRFMNEALNNYEHNHSVFSISGYSYPLNHLKDYPYSVYASYRSSSWGWCTWKDRWDSIDWDLHIKDGFQKNKTLQKSFRVGGDDLSIMLLKQMKGMIDSWAIRFAYNAFRQNKIHLLAVKSKIQNIGQDNSGIHSRRTKRFDVELFEESKFIFLKETTPPKNIHQEMKKLFTKNKIRRMAQYLKIRLNIHFK